MLKEMFNSNYSRSIIDKSINAIEFNDSPENNSSNYLLTYSNYYSDCDPKLMDLIVDELYCIKRKKTKNENIKYYVNYPTSMSMLSDSNLNNSKFLNTKNSYKLTNDENVKEDKKFFTFDPDEESSINNNLKNEKKLCNKKTKNSLYRITKETCNKNTNKTGNENESRLINIESYNNMFNNVNNSNKNKEIENNPINTEETNKYHKNNDSIESKGYYDYIVETTANNKTGLHSNNSSNFSFKYMKNDININENNYVLNTDQMSTKNSYHIDIMETNCSNKSKSIHSKLKLKDRIDFELLRKMNLTQYKNSNNISNISNKSEENSKKIFSFKPMKKEDFKKEFMKKLKFKS